MIPTEESILVTIKKMLGLEAEYAPFDQEILVDINSALFVLMQLGVGPSEGFDVTGVQETWADFLGDQLTCLKAAKDFIFLSVKKEFDPSASGTVSGAYDDKLKEVTWRLLHQVEAGETS